MKVAPNEAALTVSVFQTKAAPGEVAPKGEHALSEECSDGELGERKFKGMMPDTEKAPLSILRCEEDALRDMPATKGASIRHVWRV